MQLTLGSEDPAIKRFAAIGWSRSCVILPAYLIIDDLAACINAGSLYLAFFSEGGLLHVSASLKKKDKI